MTGIPLHIVAFDVPYPPTYGGAIDVFEKIKALSEIGTQIILHVFVYRRPPAPELEDYCAEVHYYDRLPPYRSLPINYPHIVRSRQSKALLNRLSADNIPILFEGLHCTWYLSHPDFASRKLLVRLHNVEWEYYHMLAEREPGLWKKQYLQAESRQLRHWENMLQFADHLLTISPADTQYYAERFEGVRYLPAFHGHDKILAKSGRGDYCLYHGNLGVAENHEAAEFLIKEVFAQLTVPLIIAGADPRPELIEWINQYDHISLRHNPGSGELFDLMRDAQLHVLPTFQRTGIKLKLLNSLFLGRYVLVNPTMVYQTDLEFGTVVCADAAAFRQQIQQLFGRAFGEIELAQRRAALGTTFDQRRNAQALTDLIRGLPAGMSGA